MQPASFSDRLHLGINLAATIVGGERHSVAVEIGGFAMQGQIAPSVGFGGANQSKIDMDRLVAEIFATIDRDEFDQCYRSRLVAAPGVESRIRKGPEADARDQPGPLRPDLAHEVRDDAGGKRIGLDKIIPRQLLHRGDQLQWPPITRRTMPFMRESTEAAIAPVADAERVDDREIAWDARS